MEQEKLLTVREVATLLSCGKGLVYILASERRIPSFKVGKLLRFKRSDINNYLEQCKLQAVDQPC